MRVLIMISAIGALISGCAKNPYVENYTQYYDPVYVSANRAEAAQDPHIEPGSTPQQDIPAYYQNGYMAIGFSKFSGKLSNGQLALEQAKRISADVVVVYQPQYERTQSGAMPISMPTQQTYSSQSMATAYNAYGTTNAYGSTSGTVNGQQWMMMPYSVDQYSHLAAYFVRMNIPLGLHLREPNQSEATIAGTQRAVVVEVVVRGSEAYKADILPGDIIIAADGIPVDQIESTAAFASSRKGKTVDVQLIRNAKPLTKKLTVQ
ncbi:PDZ domain-containing protein [Pseudomonas sp. BN415]|uniref:PDZ domain-containing protein n=1 Tax=Pseudomonas sp. BN415 TaxID=2567889 RepID=UPI00245639E7|nr:PDZ domain-containing protein [Pseudomonas sp. BN415]MDH4581408.1 PDZ domain-containing protein [Pseudomonas sp. BN415]